MAGRGPGPRESTQKCHSQGSRNRDEENWAMPIPYGMLRPCAFISYHTLPHGEMHTALMESVVMVMWGWV